MDEKLELLANLSTGLLGVSITLVALVPTLFELLRTHSPGFIEQLQGHRNVRRLGRALQAAIVLLGGALASALIGILKPASCWLTAATALFASGAGILVLGSIVATNAVLRRREHH